MKLKKEKKIRKLLGSRFHLYVNDDGNWKLFRKYDNLELYFSNENIEIMNSKNNSEKELLKFAKKNRKYDVKESLTITTLSIVWLVVILSFANIFIKSTLIRGFILGVDLLALCQAFIKLVVEERNYNQQIKDLSEKIELQKKILINELENNKE